MFPEPIATYRLQLHSGFGFSEATEIMPYLARLGISHIYTSPYLQAASGSTHGYDVVDPTRVNTELGGKSGHARFCRTLKKTGLGHVLDIVPNHMAILGSQNPWWWDVLENGPSSTYASYFDVDWESSEDRWPNKVLLPVLGDHYGRILESGELKLSHEKNVFTFHYYEHVFPVDPSSLGGLLASAARAVNSDLLGFIADSCNRLPRPTVTSRRAVTLRHRDKAVIQQLLTRLSRENAIQEAIIAEVERINQDLEALDALLDKQNYRLALWRTAGRDLGYRRFFDINELAGLRVEDEEVFMATHALPIEWFREGKVQGLRVDHPDGLRDPTGYFKRLRKHCPRAWILAEKILEKDEEIPLDWPIQGTTGYDFINLAGGLLVDPDGEKPLTEFYTGFIGESVVYTDLVKKSKQHVIHESLGSELNRLAALFVAVCERHPRHRDYTRDDLHNALLQVCMAFPVYRTYVRTVESKQQNQKDSTKVSSTDKLYVRQAIEEVRAQNSGTDHELLNFLEKILLLEFAGDLELELAMRFQQFTGAAMAKGVEDTAFYRFNRLLCQNEVGGDPGSFGVLPEEFHRQGVQAQSSRPLSLLAGTTHDTKRGEDVRTRLALLSEIPAAWIRTVKRWFRQNKKYRENGLPEPNMEYFIYQTLVGAWPISGERLRGYLEKAMREAKLNTSWTRQNQAYEEKVQDFVQDLLEDTVFCAQLQDFIEPLIPAGRINSLSQTLLKLTFPGVPDIYQGCELWDMSLVDPDNRRPVDFVLRKKLMAELPGLGVDEIMARMEEGLPKLWLVCQTLHFRGNRPSSFGPESSYGPLYASGSKAPHVFAFQRAEDVITVVPRLVLRLKNQWQRTSLELPPGSWLNVLTGERLSGGSVLMSRLLAHFPVALLSKENE